MQPAQKTENYMKMVKEVKETAQNDIMSALEDGLELMQQNPTGISLPELAVKLIAYVALANKVARSYGFNPYFRVPSNATAKGGAK